jgi:hypothetical protein
MAAGLLIELIARDMEQLAAHKVGLPQVAQHTL